MEGAVQRANLVRTWVNDLTLGPAPQSFVGQEVFPTLNMTSLTQKVKKWNRGDYFRNTARKRAPGSVTPAQQDSFTYVNVDTAQYAEKRLITEEDLSAAGLPTDGSIPPSNDLQARAVRRNAEALDLSREILIATAVKQGTWMNGESGSAGSQYGVDADAGWINATAANNTLIADVDLGVRYLRAQGCPRQNVRLIMDAKTWALAQRCTVLTQYFLAAANKQFPNAAMTQELVASVLGIEKVLVGDGVYNSADPAAAETDFTAANIWDGNNSKGFGFLYYFPPTGVVMDNETRCAGAVCTKPMPNGQARETTEWWNNDTHSWNYETRESVGAQLIDLYCGALWLDTHTT